MTNVEAFLWIYLNEYIYIYIYMINAFLQRLRRFGYMNCEITIYELMHKYDCDLIRRNVCHCVPEHCLTHLLLYSANFKTHALGTSTLF
jgi:hypothetical protein